MGQLDKIAGPDYNKCMGLPMKRLWLVGVLLVLLVGGVLVRHAGMPVFSGQQNQIQQTPLAPPKLEPGHTAENLSSSSETLPQPQKLPEHPENIPDPRVQKSDQSSDAGLVLNDPGSAAPLELLSPADAVEGVPGEEIVKGTVERGDTVSKVLENTGSDGIYQYVSAAGQVFSMRSFREGQPYVIVTDTASGRVKRFEYEIDNHRRLVVEGIEEPVARVEAIEYVTLLATVEATISDNLFQAVADVGESPQMALRLADLFGTEINFIRDLQVGDSFSVLVEKRYREGDYKGYGRILAAHFTNKGKTFEAYLFRDGNNRAQYYNRKGENLRKTLLQAPLAFTRLTSRFTMSRKHPILGYNRPHLGVDYAAPTGTPVKAVGEGVVTKRGWAGGYGNQIIIKHAAGLESMYAHLSGYARGLRQGQRVRQGQVIGFVGSTGLSTGPHLDFRLRQNGKFINPTKAINPRGAPVSPKRMAEFEKTVVKELAYLKGQKSLAEYTVDSLVPEIVIQTDKVVEESQEQKPAARKKRGRS